MSRAEISLLVYKYIGTHEGYLNHFSYSTHDSFYAEYCDGFDVDVPAMRRLAGTTKNTFLKILEDASPLDQARIIRGVLAKITLDEMQPDDREKKAPLAAQLVEIAARLEGAVVPATQPAATTDTVQRALADAETLLRSRGPVSALDRVHTALHGHLKHLCAEAGINVGDDPSVTALWTALIREHPAFALPEPRGDEIRRILRSGSAIVDAVNTIRNNASVAHPNADLLGEHEAWLVINVARSLFHYLDQKLGAAPAPDELPF